MVRTLDDITKQAQQGSVAAIIQVLNAQLAESRIRARAVLSQGILQLLCEADSPSKLNQSTLVEQLQTTLNSLQPRYVRRVRVNTRLVSEQQLLWLDEIERDPEGQLLWTAEFFISRPRLDQQLRNTWTDWCDRSHLSGIVLADTAKRERRKRRAWQALVGSSGLVLFLALVGWVTYDFLGLKQRHQGNRAVPERLANDSIETANRDRPLNDDGANNDGGVTPESQAVTLNPNQGNEGTNTTTLSSSEPSSSAHDLSSPPVSSPSGSPDPFTQAVRIAEQSVADGQVATTVDEWMELATRWQRASELMNSVSPDDERYATAQDRTTLYLQNSVDSRKQAELVRQEQAD